MDDLSLREKLAYADHMLVAVSNQRNNAHNEVVHLEAKLAIARSRIADLEAEVLALREKRSANGVDHAEQGLN